jgi:hypothetical protein
MDHIFIWMVLTGTGFAVLNDDSGQPMVYTHQEPATDAILEADAAAHNDGGRAFLMRFILSGLIAIGSPPTATNVPHLAD